MFFIKSNLKSIKSFLILVSQPYDYAVVIQYYNSNAVKLREY